MNARSPSSQIVNQVECTSFHGCDVMLAKVGMGWRVVGWSAYASVALGQWFRRAQARAASSLSDSGATPLRKTCGLWTETRSLCSESCDYFTEHSRPIPTTPGSPNPLTQTPPSCWANPQKTNVKCTRLCNRGNLEYRLRNMAVTVTYI